MRLQFISAVTLTLAMALPSIAQGESYPRIEVAVGYANLTLASYEGPLGGLYFGKEHHSGISTDFSWNPVPWFGMNNYTGVYGLGNGTTLVANIPGGKI